jgi:plastocyanin
MSPGAAMSGRRAVSLAVLLLATACGSPASQGDDNSSQQSAAGAPVLKGTVGSEKSHDAFEISLVDDKGNPVTTLPAGKYNVEVTDWSPVHNFHLNGGNGAVEEKTGVTGTGEITWVITFEPGEYRFMCDPHPSMNGRFTVG